jgi:hypothetical protein
MKPAVKIADLKTADDIKKHLPNCYRSLVSSIPQSMHLSAVTWVWFGVNLGGDFFTAIINNDLVEAFGRADNTNARLMNVYASWLHNVAPHGSWGSEENLKKWSDVGGLIGIHVQSGDTIADNEGGW